MTTAEALSEEISRRMRRSEIAIPVGVSASHCHLTQDHFEKLFGAGRVPAKNKSLKQPGFWTAIERVEIRGPKGAIKNFAFVAPFRARTQVELAASDARRLGLAPPVRESGDLNGSVGATLVGPAGSVTIGEGVIIARRHLHFSPAEAAAHGIQSGEVVRVRAGSQDGRAAVFEGVVVRVSDKYSLEFHVDVDEANAAGLRNGDVARMA